MPGSGRAVRRGIVLLDQDLVRQRDPSDFLRRPDEYLPILGQEALAAAVLVKADPVRMYNHLGRKN